MSPLQEVFMLCKKTAKETFKNKVDVYDYLQGNDVKYPYIFIGEQFARDKRNKTAVFGNITQKIYVINNDFRKRGTTIDIMNKLLYELRKCQKTNNFNIDLVNVDTVVFADNSTKTPLLKCMLELEFKFN